MKKLTIILLALVYGLSSSGMSVTLHYCMSEFSGWDISANASPNACTACGMKKQDRKGCCHDEKKTVKSEKDQKNLEVFSSSLKAPVGYVNTSNAVYSPDSILKIEAENPSTHAPPYNKVPVYIYHCTFRV